MGEKSRGNFRIPKCLPTCVCRGCQEKRRRVRKRVRRSVYDFAKEVLGMNDITAIDKAVTDSIKYGKGTFIQTRKGSRFIPTR